MRNTLVAGTTLLAALAATAVPAAAAPAPLPVDKMVIDVVAANGSGCPLGTADVTVSPDNKAFTVTYSEFTAQVGVGARPLDFRKNCQLALNVDVPQGFTYAIARTDYRGFVRLEKGASATQSSFYYFQGDLQTHKTRHDFTGPADGDWQRTDTIGISSVSFLPCGERRFLNVNTELRVNAGWSDRKKTTSFLTMDSTDGNLDTVYHVAWRKC
ncbi:hypothetical protein AMIS_26020 [Actinoplanes missouriensis 431]|uniref:DUF4360 domain-containing protein n=1 Tax=Actinoplanes missouriensis (strain ATCC 14538 / DSM 43046 / CBS 188.64 / JCM 3121 / NBRC 102363 / NCIMB 12654 / NRRL B-3342 / UNCC 431) TaxID=512565 RepID=I0H485_ACTM4|nr:DUF4360 domain-containing protein [Actinoplanes missouriensis]BAL87822.1 hypothetical protein AMIS_26020 [Actinoplanes missouriensis 431]